MPLPVPYLSVNPCYLYLIFYLSIGLATERALKALKAEADARGVKAQAYYERGDSARFAELIKKSEAILGKGNVFIFDK